MGKGDKFMKQCKKCGKIKDYTEFYISSLGYLQSWCKDCIKRKDIMGSNDIGRKIKVNKRMSKKESRWEKAKAENAKKCAERRKRYEEFIKSIQMYPSCIQNIMIKHKNPVCELCGERKTRPYLFKDKWVWRCKKHKINS